MWRCGRTSKVKGKGERAGSEPGMWPTTRDTPALAPRPVCACGLVHGPGSRNCGKATSPGWGEGRGQGSFCPYILIIIIII